MGYDPVRNPIAFDWSGFYIGGHAGYALGGDFTARAAAGTARGDLDGFVGGAYGGYNFQTGNVVLGGEADVSFGEIDGDAAGLETIRRFG